MKWTLINPAGTNDPDTGDIYSGLDRFGRVKDNRWIDGAGSDLDRIQYGYDRAGNRLWRKNVVAESLGKQFDELYTYDGVHRLKDMARGTLNGSQTALSSETFAECWTLDSTGNWKGYRQDDNGDGTWDLVQARAANPINEISGITNTTGPSWTQPAYNRAGNMTTMPQPADPTASYTATYDAWNRLVKIADGSDTVSEYAYDGTKRRIAQKSYTDGTLDETRHLYYTNEWQVVEERLGTPPDSADAERQFVWGKRYIDDLVVRDRDTDANGSLDERLYACQDANWNVTAIINTSAAVQERYAYSSYGVPVFLTTSFIVDSDSSADWEILYCGYRYEVASTLFHVRYRVYHPSVGEWLQRDLLTYWDTTNLLQYVRSSPISNLDWIGLLAMPWPGGGTTWIPRIAPGTGRLPVPRPLYRPYPRTPTLGPDDGLLPRDGFPFNGGYPKPDIPTLPKPGKPPCRRTCNDATYYPLVNKVNQACPEEARTCDSIFGAWVSPSMFSCADIAERTDELLNCLKARIERETKCFDGGNPGHQERMKRLRDEAQKCADLGKYKGCYDENPFDLGPGIA